MAGMLDFNPRNPYRAVDWRWSRAGDVLDGGAPVSRRRDDVWVRRAVDFRTQYDLCKTPYDLHVLAEQSPAIYWAYEVWRRVGDVAASTVLRHALEARLLATQSYDEIAVRTPLEVATIDAYQWLFFNVADRHDQIDYIAQTVFGPQLYRGLSMRDYHLLWKLYGWGYGPMFIDMFLTTFSGRGRPSDAAGFAATIEDVAKASMKVKGMLAAQTMKITDMSATLIFAEFQRLCQDDKAGGHASGAQQTLLVNIQAMMASLPFRVGADKIPPAVADRAMSVAGLGEYDTTGAELRGDELMQLAIGASVPAAGHMHMLAFPPPNLTEGVIDAR